MSVTEPYIGHMRFCLCSNWKYRMPCQNETVYLDIFASASAPIQNTGCCVVIQFRDFPIYCNYFTLNWLSAAGQNNIIDFYGVF